MRVNKKFKISLIVFLVAGITVFHYSTKLSQHHLHIIHQVSTKKGRTHAR